MSREGPELVSTIIPVFNRAALLRQAVQSVLNQTYYPIEIIIVDDGSTDETSDVAEQLCNEFPHLISVIHQTNAGPGVARQKGLERALGSFIQFLDSDDLLLKDKFSAQVAALKEQRECQICYGKSFEEDHSFNPPLRVGPIRATGYSVHQLFPMLLVSRWWTTSSPLYRKSLLDRIGPWTELINEEDWEYDARAGATGALLAWVDIYVSVRRLNMGGEHLSEKGCEDPKKLADRAEAKASIYRSAQVAGVDIESYEMRHFARSAFLLSRQCGLANVPIASRNLFLLARQASTPRQRDRLEYRIYATIARVLGWCLTAKLSVLLYRIVHSRRAA